ncbi:excalibur calcium-binding domain-containing protein [Novilysobacter antarcticus]|uniref:excalibur calcium-binding domain-containing protein n=1 Tax=Novilysobacter antarcticus TaxID=2862543 RepID=UPI0024848836|nr:excalibur calcium-binding domain-containing protein [Lysobacter antarcticus]
MSSCKTLVALALLLVSASAIGHSGGLNSDGCHTNRSTGDYHCHRGSSPKLSSSSRQTLSPTRLAPAPSKRGVFHNCAAARAAGAAPVRRGDPGYGPHLDRDNDGIGCE